MLSQYLPALSGLRRWVHAVALLLAFTLPARATHIAGGEIYWDCLGPGNYQFSLVIYRDCAGQALNNAYTLRLDGPCGIDSVVVDLQSQVEISQLCNAQLSNSRCNGGTQPGIQEYIYTGTVSGLAPCDSWHISWDQRYRNAAIANLVNPGGTNMYIEAVMNTVEEPCNDSPHFSNIAIPYVCAGQPVSFSYGAYDIEGDSLSYRLIQARGEEGDLVGYMPGYSPTVPIPGLTLDPVTGLVTFTLATTGHYVVVVEVQIWDADGNLIGSIMRDMQFIARNCANQPPDPTSGTISTITGTGVQTAPYALQVCESGDFCARMIVTDPNGADVLTATSNVSMNLPGATLTTSGTNPLTIDICWSAADGTEGFYPFIITVDDGSCPIPAFQTYVYSVEVIPGLHVITSTTNEACSGNDNGTASVLVTEGEAPFTYLWNTGATSSSITDGAGTYDVVVTDANGCVNHPANLVIAATSLANTVNGGADVFACMTDIPVVLNGTVTNATGGTWSGGTGTFTGTGLNVTYQPSTAEFTAGGLELFLTATGTGACPPDRDSVLVILPNSFRNSAINAQHITCNGGANGQAVYTPNSPMLTYLWSPSGQTTSTATGLNAGVHTIQVSDFFGCDTTLSITVNEPAALSIASMAIMHESCAGAGNGSLTPTVTGGTGAYGYLWSTGATTPSITVGAGNYNVTVTDGNGCSVSAGPIAVSAAGQPNQANAGADRIACFDELPVSLSGTVVNATGGIWSGGAGTFTGAGLNRSYMPTLAEVNSGSVELYLTTTGNTTCPPAQDTIVITLPSSFFGSTITSSNVLCNGGNSGSAGFLPNDPSFTFLWTDAAAQTTATASNLVAGTYALTIRDTFGCDTTATVSITQPAPLIFNSVTTTPEQCAGNNDGSVTANVAGGTLPYSYSWNNGDTTASIAAGAGAYIVQVTDANGCSITSAPAFVNALGQPNVADAGADHIGCFDELPVALNGTVTNATGGIWSGGTGTFTGSGLNVTYAPTMAEVLSGGIDLYLTTTGNTTCPPDQDTVHIALPTSFFGSGITTTAVLCNAGNTGSAEFAPDNAGLTYSWSDAAAQTTATATGLIAGNYTLTVSDAFGCDTTLNTTITEPAALLITAMDVQDEQCAGQADGTITPMVSGGTGTYTYLWSTSEESATITVGAGTYSVTVTDANGCSISSAPTVVNAIGQPNAVDAGADLIGCFDELPIALSGTVTNATGGTWSGGAGTFSGTGTSVTYAPTMSEVLSGGIELYLTSTGNVTCPTAQDTIHITLPHSFFGSGLSATHLTCNNDASGSAVFAPDQSSFTYLWDDANAQTTPIAHYLPAGTHGLTVTDTYGCDTTLYITITEPPALVMSNIVVQHPTCPDALNGIATAVVTGGSFPYTFSWSDNANGQTTQTINGLGSGSYTATVTDAHGCTAQNTGTLTAPPPITLVVDVPDTVCVNTPVQMTALATGGSGTYSINWSGIGTGDTLTHAFTATQNVTIHVTDGAGCSGPTLVVPVNVQDLNLASLVLLGDTVICPGGTAYVGAAIANYPGEVTFHWPTLQTTGAGPYEVHPLVDGGYPVVVTDACGTQVNGTVPVDIQFPPTIELPPIIAEGCAPLTVQMPSGLTTDPVSYLWDFGNGAQSVAVSPTHVYVAGVYEVNLTVTTPIGCVGQASTSGQVIAHQPPTAQFTASAWEADFDHANIQFLDASTGPGAIVGTFWHFGDDVTTEVADPSHLFTDVGTFLVQLHVTDEFGCTGSITAPVQITPVYDITIPNAFTPNPFAGNGGTYDPNDLSNDVFYPFIRFVEDYSMRIYNRWGELVFETSDIRQGWDGYYRGQLSQQDVYAYKLWVRFIDDTEMQKLGDITLFR